MKILFINTKESDGIQDLTYSGIAKILGAENVIEYPWNSYYHFNRRKYPRINGYVKGSLSGSLKALLRRKEYDFVFVGAAKPECLENYLDVVDSIPAEIPVVFLDGGDFAQIGGDFIRLNSFELYQQAIQKREFDIIFKREYLEDKDLGKNVFPLPMSFNYDYLPEKLPGEFKYRVSFWAVESNPIRTAALELLEDKFDCRENGTSRNQTFRKYKRKGKYYLQEIAACKIVISCPGVGWDTFRYWEVPALGRFMISVRPKIKIPNNFVPDKDIVFCKDDLSDLVELCDYYLKNESLREKIAQNAEQHSRKYHTDLARGQYILEILNNYKSGKTN